MSARARANRRRGFGTVETRAGFSRPGDAADRRALPCFVCVGRYRRKRCGARKTCVENFALSLLKKENTYWTLETNTPFYGWGLAGRVETTALVVQALKKRR